MSKKIATSAKLCTDHSEDPNKETKNKSFNDYLTHLSKSARFISRDSENPSPSQSPQHDKNIYYSQVFSKPNNKLETEKKNSFPTEVKIDSIEEKELVVKNKTRKMDEGNKTNPNQLYYGLKLFSILGSGLCLNEKLVVILAFMTIITSILLLIFELDVYLNSICKPIEIFSEFFIFFNSIFSIVAKICILNMVNLELIIKKNYTRIISCFLFWGCTSILQMPAIIYDYLDCSLESQIFTINFSFNLINGMGIIIFILIGFLIMYLSFMMWGCQLNFQILFFLKKIFFYCTVIIVGILNVFHLIVTFSQIDYFLPNFFFDNIIYFAFLIAYGVFRIVVKKESGAIRKASEENGLSE